MKRWFTISAALAALLPVPCGAGEVSDYLTKDGKLKAAITVRVGTGGLVAVGGSIPKAEGWVAVIQPTGEWSREQPPSKWVLPVSPAKGKLHEKQLAALAQHLATQDFKSLPRQQGCGYPGSDVVYRYVMIEFGEKRAEFMIKLGQSRIDYLPKPGDPKAAAWSRFVAVELFLMDMFRTTETKGQEPESPDELGAT